MRNLSIVSAAVLWLCGYAAAAYVPWIWAWSFFAFSALMAVIGHRMNRRLLFLSLSLMIIASSLLYYRWYDGRNFSRLTAVFGAANSINESPVQLKGTIDSPVGVDGDKASFVMKVTSAGVGGTSMHSLNEKVQVSVRLLIQDEVSLAAQWGRGDQAVVGGTLKLPSEARNFGGFDYRGYLRLKGIHWTLSVNGAQEVKASQSSDSFSSNRLLRWNDDFRTLLAAKTEQVFPKEQGGFMKSMLLGMQDEVEPALFDRFSRLGLTHILAVSGLNVAVFVGSLMWVARRLGATKETNMMIAICSIPFYIALTGGSPSIVRAGIMAMLGLYLARRGLMKDVLRIAAAVALLMLVWNPYYWLDISFQLSYLVTVGIIIGVPRMSRLLPVANRTLNGALSVTIVAQLLSFPITIYYFNSFSLLSLPANLLFVPVFSAAVLPAGTAALLTGFVSVTVGQWLGWAVAQVNSGIFYAVERLSGWTEFTSIWPAPTVLWIALYYVFIYLIYAGCDRESRFFSAWLLPVSVSCTFLLLFYGYTPDRWNTDGTVEFIDVGQGDCILIRTPEGRHILVDGGGTQVFRKPGEEWKQRKDPYEAGRKLVVPLLKKRGIHRLDTVILTHEDNDHAGGLQAVLQTFPVTRFVFNGTLKSSPPVEKLFTAAVNKRIPLLPAGKGIRLAEGAETVLDFYYPLEGKGGIKPLNQQNNVSLVFLLGMKGSKFLFTGDMEKPAEMELLRGLGEKAGVTADVASPVPAAAKHRIDVLKVAHHGSKTSTTEEWLRYWNPAAAVISVGEKNSYGHPSQGVVDRLQKHGAALFRTDRQGGVQMRVTGSGIETRTKLE